MTTRKRLYNLSMIESYINAANSVKTRVKSLSYIPFIAGYRISLPHTHTPAPAAAAQDSLTEIPAHSSHLALRGKTEWHQSIFIR